jgi:hypothetical protein
MIECLGGSFVGDGSGVAMPELSTREAEEALRQDGRWDWLLSGRRAWSVMDVARAYEEATGVGVSHDTVMRWFKRLPPGGAEKYPGAIGWRAFRDALVVFFAAGKHLAPGNADDGAPRREARDAE